MVILEATIIFLIVMIVLEALWFLSFVRDLLREQTRDIDELTRSFRIQAIEHTKKTDERYHELFLKYTTIIEDRSHETWPLPTSMINTETISSVNLPTIDNSNTVPLEDSPVWDNPELMKEKMKAIDSEIKRTSKKK